MLLAEHVDSGSEFQACGAANEEEMLFIMFCFDFCFMLPIVFLFVVKLLLFLLL